jgi:hypothetical protein
MIASFIALLTRLGQALGLVAKAPPSESALLVAAADQSDKMANVAHQQLVGFGNQAKKDIVLSDAFQRAGTSVDEVVRLSSKNPDAAIGKLNDILDLIPDQPRARGTVEMMKDAITREHLAHNRAAEQRKLAFAPLTAAQPPAPATPQTQAAAKPTQTAAAAPPPKKVLINDHQLREALSISRQDYSRALETVQRDIVAAGNQEAIDKQPGPMVRIAQTTNWALLDKGPALDNPEQLRELVHLREQVAASFPAHGILNRIDSLINNSIGQLQNHGKLGYITKTYTSEEQLRGVYTNARDAYAAVVDHQLGKVDDPLQAAKKPVPIDTRILSDEGASPTDKLAAIDRARNYDVTNNRPGTPAVQALLRTLSYNVINQIGPYALINMIESQRAQP